MSPESKLLEQLASGDLSLQVAVELFPKIDQAKRVIDVYVRSETIQLMFTRGDDEAEVVQPWRIRSLLNDPKLWCAESDLREQLSIRLTEHGQQRLADNSESLLAELFGR
jgi:hypothetical protein